MRGWEENLPHSRFIGVRQDYFSVILHTKSLVIYTFLKQDIVVPHQPLSCNVLCLAGAEYRCATGAGYATYGAMCCATGVGHDRLRYNAENCYTIGSGNTNRLPCNMVSQLYLPKARQQESAVP